MLLGHFELVHFDAILMKIFAALYVIHVLNVENYMLNFTFVTLFELNFQEIKQYSSNLKYSEIPTRVIFKDFTRS